MSPLSGRKQTRSCLLRIRYERNAPLCIQTDNWHKGIPRNKSRSAVNMNYNNFYFFFFQPEPFQRHKYSAPWLYVTHLRALFHPSFYCLAQTALMPFSLSYRHFLCAILAPHFVVFSSFPYRRDTQPQKNTHIHQLCLCGLQGLSLQCPC